MDVSPIGFGAFKIGRNQQIKYSAGYALPDEAVACRLLHEVLDLGVNLIDTAPAYGLSEQRIGKALLERRRDFILSTKAGETFDGGKSRYDFSKSAIRRSVQGSLTRLCTDVIDILLIHSDGDDEAVLDRSDAVETVLDLREAGLAHAVGFSGKTVDGAFAALGWADVIMVPYSPLDTSHSGVLDAAAEADVGVLVKKGLDSGRVDPQRAIPFVLGHAGVSSLVIGGLDVAHIRQNIAIAERAGLKASAG